MTDSKAIIVQDLGWGDSGKGSIVDYFCEKNSADLVVKFCGGHQCGHTVIRDNRRHIFSQFGSGTLLGVPTYLDKNFIVDPCALSEEAKHLESLGVKNPLELIKIHPRCLVTTYYHRELNRIKCKDKNCSVGVGIGETIRYALANYDDAIRFEDLYDLEVLREKLFRLRNYLLREYKTYTFAETGFGYDVTDIFDDLYKCYVEKSYPPSFKHAILEGSQGTLLDEWKGFYPYNCWHSTTGKHAVEFLERVGCECWDTIGITRRYSTKHGAGPFPTETNKFSIPNEVPENEYQGPFRVGWLDHFLLRYAIKCNELDRCPIDYLAVTCLDHIEDSWIDECFTYENSNIEPPHYNDLDLSLDNTMELKSAEPIYVSGQSDSLILLERMRPIYLISKGSTAKDKELF